MINLFTIATKDKSLNNNNLSSKQLVPSSKGEEIVSHKSKKLSLDL